MKSKKIISIGLPMIAVTYGLARFSYGLVLPYLRDSLNMSQSTAGMIGSLAYASYIVAIIIAMIYMQKWGPRVMILISGITAVIGMALIASAQSVFVLGIGILIAGSGAGFASPAYTQGIDKWINVKKRSQTNTWVNSGTSLGTAVTGAIVIFLTDDWRLTFIIFTITAIIVLLINYQLLPKNDEKTVESSMEFDVIKKHIVDVIKKHIVESIPLMIVSLLLGITMGGYWTFSRDWVYQMVEVPDIIQQGFWIIIGLAGILGGFAGNISAKIGLVASYRLGVIVTGISSLLLGLFATGIPIAISAILFGSSYIFITGILILWGIGIFKDNASMGLGISYLLLTVGQLLGSGLGGMIAELTSYETNFIVFGIIALVAVFFKPKEGKLA